MKTVLAILAAAALSGCGLDAASSAATAGSIKKRELQEGQKTMQGAQQKLDAATEQLQRRAGSSEQ